MPGFQVITLAAALLATTAVSAHSWVDCVGMSAPGSCKGGARTTGGDNWITASSSQPICLGAIYHPEWRDFQAPASVVQGETIRVTWPCNNHCQQAGKEKIGVYVSQNVADYQLTPSQYLGSKTPFLTGTYGGSLAQDTSLLPVTGKRGYPTGGTEISYLDIKIDSNFKCGLNYLVWAWDTNNSAYYASCFDINVNCGGGGNPTTTTTVPPRTTTSATTRIVTSTTTTTRAATTTTQAPTTGAPLYGQCGGQGWSGATTCAQGTCKVSNQWYSQCLP